jgi:predicted nucleotidyltransferase
MNAIHKKIAEYFKSQDGVVALYLFGSHAANSPRPFSDIDIGIIAEHADFVHFLSRERKRNQKKTPIRRGPAGCPALLAAGGEQ